MLNNKHVAVVVKAYNEEKQIGKVIDGMPDFVDRIVVVNDGSKDGTSGVVRKIISGSEDIRYIPKPEEIVEDDNGFNRADILLHKMRKSEEVFFPKHGIFNDNEDDRIVLIDSENSGPGGTVSVGYKWCRDHEMDCTVVIDGDGQMDPGEMKSLVSPIVGGWRTTPRETGFPIPHQKLSFRRSGILGITF